MEECKRIIEVYKKEFWENKDNPKYAKELVENALDIMKIVDIGTNDTIGYIVVLGVGGPNIELNTRDGALYCDWGMNHEVLTIIPRELIQAIENYLDELGY